ncbi:MAG: TerB family tellurite resistance protein [Aestuariivita sp.]|nr:TerB family tellurite resistance protein [Aestuariivita sp.]MCY4201934.1 TerB family tellurite resistance protein [Aestuariivita sp.]MCY4288820.1 TerB family tellurite resistance protein [Aestuariivita sp.]MCY4345259.1 TerB family tellurite resistance protein [Aestuariivita sp.]
MLAKLLQQLSNSPPPQSNSSYSKGQVALAALMVRIARADGEYTRDEATEIDRFLIKRFDLTLETAENLRGEAEAFEAAATDTVRFTREIKQSVNYDDRLSVIEGLWTIALADDNRDHNEDAVIRLATNLLGITDVESARARQRVSKS